MGSFRAFVLLAVVCSLLWLSSPLLAQSGAITGTVKDNQGAVIPGAQVTLIDQDRAGQRSMASSADGLFMFDSLPPSNYQLVVTAPGFKTFEKKDIKLYASDRIGVSDIIMEIGQVSESITVEASTAQLQTESAKVEGVVTSQQMTELATYNRNFMNMLRTVPGVIGLTTGSTGGQVNVNGMRSDQVAFKLDGMLNMDTGNNSCCSSLPNLDLIAEMKVVTNGATADMGSVGAAQILVVTKSGSKEFHGDIYYFRRHESMDANGWLRNFNNQTRTRNRQNQAGFTLGGPIFLPKLFNTKKDKLFFMVSEELWRNQSPSTTTSTVPTALERTGDFSQSRRANDNTVITVLDPLNNRTPFPGNVVPSDRWNSDAQKLMALMPLPNVTTPGVYNYNYSRSNSSNYTDYLSQAYKVDYNLSEKWRVYGRFSRDYNESGTPLGMGSFEFDNQGRTMGWNLDWRTSWNAVLNVTTIISPTSTNELVLGGARNSSHFWVDKANYLRKNLGLGYNNPNPALVVGDYGPQVSFAGTGNTNFPTLGTGRPYHADNPDYQVSDNFTKIFERHTLKAGATFQIDRKDQDMYGGSAHAGAFQFSRDSQNPGDTDYQYANFLTGSFQTFQQIQKWVQARYLFHQGEWYVMDTWKARRNLTLDVGLRFSVFQPCYEKWGQLATFDAALWNPAKAVKLYGYAPGGKAVDPATGILYPSFMRGAIVVNSGDIDNGFTLAGKDGIPKGLMPYAGIQVAPRIGIAWQPEKLPKTVIRLGGGIFKDRIQTNISQGATQDPPTARNSTLEYGYISDISSALYNIYTPPSFYGGGYTGTGKIPTTINWNLSIEQELPGSTLAKVAYVGSISRHLVSYSWVNAPAYGSAWLPQNQDPTVAAPKYDGTTSLPINYYRPYVGIGNISMFQTGGSSNYNALQVQLERRMSRKLSYGVAYTWAKAMGIGDFMWTWTNPFDARAYNYSRLPFDRTQVLTANFVYHLPKWGKGGNLLDHRGIRLALNDWELSGMVIAQTGTPTQFTFSYSSGVSNLARQWTGNEEWGPRPYVTQWKLSNPTDLQHFNVNAIQPAVIPSVGLESGLGYLSAPTTFFSSPEMTLMKNVVYSQDNRRYVQLRLEAFNAFNHHDYTGIGTNASFASPTNLTLTNLPLGVPGGSTRFGFGALSGAAAGRRLQISLKIYF